MSTVRWHNPKLAVLLMAPIAIGALLRAYAAPEFELHVLSSRPDLVTGSDVLIEARAPQAALQSLKLELNDHDVSASLKAGPVARTVTGRIEGLRLGKNTLQLLSGGKRRAALDLIDHPITGPLFSGPQLQPFHCDTEPVGLGRALDKECDAKTQVAYFYRSTDKVQYKSLSQDDLYTFKDLDCPALPCSIFRQLGFKKYDPSAPRPADMSQTTTTEGHTVDYIVRRERGVINRAIYDIYFLHQPGQPLPDPWTRIPGWNGRLVFDFGAGGYGGYRQGIPWLPLVNPLPVLSQGYALAVTSLTGIFVPEDVVASETAEMVKEYFIKQFGVPVHTIGWGGSGGAVRQMMIADTYPGILDGIIPGGIFPDIVTGDRYMSCQLLDHAFKISPESWTFEQKSAVAGYASWDNCKPFFMPATPDPNQDDCNSGYGPDAVPKSQLYDRVKNPHGVRCNEFDTAINVWGRDPATGYARRALDNVGLQYGLGAFNAGKISADQFLDLNDKIGGFDDDMNVVSTRTVATPEALRIAYQTGRVFSGKYARIPIIDTRGYGEMKGDAHDSIRSLEIQARLMESNGRADNQVILTFPPAEKSKPGNPAPESDDPNSKSMQHNSEILRQMDEWLDNIAKDTAPGDALDKIARDKPASLADACWTDEYERIAEPRTLNGPGRCYDLYPPHSDMMMVAGMPLDEMIIKCALKEPARTNYQQPLTDAQWARLKQVFPQGVCDFSKPGIMQQPEGPPWRTY